MHQCVKYFMENLHPHILLFPGFFFYRMFQSLGGRKKQTNIKTLDFMSAFDLLKILKRYIPRQFKLGKTCPSISAFTFLPNQAEKTLPGKLGAAGNPSRFHSFNTCCGTVLCPYYPGDRFFALERFVQWKDKERGRLLTKCGFLNRSF